MSVFIESGVADPRVLYSASQDYRVGGADHFVQLDAIPTVRELDGRRVPVTIRKGELELGYLPRTTVQVTLTTDDTGRIISVEQGSLADRAVVIPQGTTYVDEGIQTPRAVSDRARRLPVPLNFSTGTFRRAS